MDIHTSDEPTGPGAPSPACTATLLRMLANTLPHLDAESAERRDDRLEAVQETFLAFKPRDAAEAQLAALAVAAAQAATDGYTRAARPGVGHETAARNRSGALANARAYFQIFRFFKSREKAEEAAANPPPRRARAAAPEPEPQPDDSPIPSLPQFQPRDRHGNPIPLHRWQDMTRKQKLATYGDPYDTAAWAAATEEEEEMIAAQKALDAAAAPPSPPPLAGGGRGEGNGETV